MLIPRGKKNLLTLKRRVPARYAHVDSRSFVYIPLKTDSRLDAQARVDRVWAAQIAVWEAQLAGRDPDAVALQARLRDIAQGVGFAYMTATDLADAPLREILDRLRHVEGVPPADRVSVGEALMGAVEIGGLPVSDLFVRYADLTHDARRGYSDDQVRRWRNARLKAVANWIEAVGDMAVQDITRQHVLRFRAWWWTRVAAGEVKAATANKDFSHLGAMLSALYRLEGVDAPNPFHGVRFVDDSDTGLPFARAWVSGQILAPGALGGLNDQARDILFAMINTGARPSELVDLRAPHIILDHNIPHITIAPDAGRRLKTRHSARAIPLAGVSLEAFRRNPDGFPRYRGKAAKWSALVTPFMRDHGLLESPDHTPYSLRHTFSDGLQNRNCPDRTRRELMGHVVPGVNYGDGASLENRLGWIAQIAF
ncbi:MAG: tyrosine-type recombinase/integrase [Pseudomonadota bacterium]